jgi:hypothetical protein
MLENIDLSRKVAKEEVYQMLLHTVDLPVGPPPLRPDRDTDYVWCPNKFP